MTDFIIRPMHTPTWIAIHYPETFIIVSLVAVLQLIVAILCAVLAVPADPKKHFYKPLFVIIGFGLLILTLWAGVLADGAQYEADHKATTLQATLDTYKADLDKYISLARFEKTLPPEGSTKDTGKLNDLGNLIRSEQNALLKKMTTLLDKESTPPPPNNLPTKTTSSLPFAPQSQPQQAPLSQPAAIYQLNHRLNLVANCLHNADYGLTMDAMQYKPAFIFSGGRETEQLRLDLPGMKSAIKSRDDAYSRCYQDKSVREDAHKLFQMSPAQIAADDVTFEALDEKAKLPSVTEGLSPQQLLGLMFQPKYDGLINYFKQLQHPPAP